MNFAALPKLVGEKLMGEEVRERVRRSLLKDFSKYSEKPSRRYDERVYQLGISGDELTDSVQLTVSALLEQIDDLKIQLQLSEQKASEIESLVDVDCLTPLPNRRAFMRRLEWATSMHDRHGHAVSIVFFDLNGFKEINDTYGHDAGDLAIQHVADMLQDMLRDTDFVARIGGDEFAIIMYHSDDAATKKRAAEIVEVIENTPLKYGSHALHVGAAFGTYTVQNGESPEYALKQADSAMYANKKAAKRNKADA